LEAPVTQAGLVRDIAKGRRRRLLAGLSATQAALLRSASGNGAGSYLEGPPGPEYVMADKDWQTATRYRLGLPAAAVPEAARLPERCCHRGPQGTACQHALRDDDVHAIHCSLGGGTLRRHNAVARTLAEVVRDTCGATCRFEQHVPRLDDVKDGVPRRAIMDVVFQAPDGAVVLVDVSLVSACAGPAQRLMASARRDGAAADEACQLKRRRYGPEVVPFVMELGGRPSDHARAWMRKVLAWGGDRVEGPRLTGAEAWARVSCTLQRYVAAQLRAAAGV
jgi:hypothetical protein